MAAAPLVWFAYNQIVFGDWLDFARGPYSAKAIELRSLGISLPVAEIYRDTGLA